MASKMRLDGSGTAVAAPPPLPLELPEPREEDVAFADVVRPPPIAASASASSATKASSSPTLSAAAWPRAAWPICFKTAGTTAAKQIPDDAYRKLKITKMMNRLRLPRDFLKALRSSSGSLLSWGRRISAIVIGAKKRTGLAWPMDPVPGVARIRTAVSARPHCIRAIPPWQQARGMEKRRGARPPWVGRAWTAEEIALIKRVSVREAARQTGRTVKAVYH
jgi:hypothetical protein